MLQKAQEIINLYDSKVELLEKKPKDEELDTIVDDILWDEETMLALLPEVLLLKKIETERRLKATKGEKKCDKIVYRIMERLWKENFESEDGKVKRSVKYKFDVNKEELPEEYKTYSFAKIHSAISKKQTIPWVTGEAWYHSYRIS